MMSWRLWMTREIPWLAEQYLKISETTKGDPDAGRIYGEWYLASPKTRVREDLPPRLGYFLGYHVVKALSTSYSVDTMARWTPSEAHRAMKLGLQRLIAEGD